MRGPLIALAAFIVVCALIFAAWYMRNPAQPPRAPADTPSDSAPEVPASPIDAANEGRLVTVSGTLRIPVSAHDSELAVSADALELLRDVQMFQWHEDCAAATCTYEPAWSEEPINSSGFREPAGHENPVRFPFASATFMAREVQLGDFHVDTALASGDRKATAFPIDIEQLPPNLAASFRKDGDALYAGADPKQPAIGDLKVSYRVIEAGSVRLTGIQRGNKLIPATADSMH